MALWPSTLPQRPDQRGYKERLPDLLLYTQMESGPPKVRPTATKGYINYEITLVLSSSQKATLTSFYMTTLENGAVIVNWIDFTTGAAKDYYIMTPPEYTSLNGVDWLASFTMREA